MGEVEERRQTLRRHACSGPCCARARVRALRPGGLLSRIAACPMRRAKVPHSPLAVQLSVSTTSPQVRTRLSFMREPISTVSAGGCSLNPSQKSGIDHPTHTSEDSAPTAHWDLPCSSPQHIRCFTLLGRTAAANDLNKAAPPGRPHRTTRTSSSCEFAIVCPHIFELPHNLRSEQVFGIRLLHLDVHAPRNLAPSVLHHVPRVLLIKVCPICPPLQPCPQHTAARAPRNAITGRTR